MGLRFRKSIKIVPGVKLNLNKKSTSISFGGKRSGVTVNSKRGTSYRVSAPGTGISYTGKLSSSPSKRKSDSNRYSPPEEYCDDDFSGEYGFSLSDWIERRLERERPVPETWVGVVFYCLRYGVLTVLVFLYLLFYAKPIYIAIGYGIIRCPAVYSCIEIVNNQKARTEK